MKRKHRRNEVSPFSTHEKFTVQTLNLLSEKATAEKERGSKRHKAAISLQSQCTQYQPSDLIAKLRPYQLDAVKFAVDREVSPEYGDHFMAWSTYLASQSLPKFTIVNSTVRLCA